MRLSMKYLFVGSYRNLDNISTNFEIILEWIRHKKQLD